MKIPAYQLTQHLQQTLHPVYLITGNEPLLCEQARHQIIEVASQQGFNEVLLYTVEPGFAWDDIPAHSANLSLFAERRVIDCRLGKAKPGDTGTQAIQRFCEQQSPDSCLIITCDKLDGGTQRSKWVKTIEQHGAVVTVWPLNQRQFPQWLRQRLQQQQLRVDNEGLQLLAERTEGNLLAAQQEIEKLVLRFGAGQLSAAQIREAVGTSSQFDVFALVDCALQGQAQKCRSILRQLRGEGAELTLILWALSRECRSLAQLSFAVANGITPAQALQQQRIWDSRKPIITNALSRLTAATCHQCLQHAQHIDGIIKGRNLGNVWDEIERLTLCLAGVPIIEELS